MFGLILFVIDAFIVCFFSFPFSVIIRQPHLDFATLGAIIFIVHFLGMLLKISYYISPLNENNRRFYYVSTIVWYGYLGVLSVKHSMTLGSFVLMLISIIFILISCALLLSNELKEYVDENR